MKENKAMVLGCLLVIVLSGISIGCSGKSSVVGDISMGIFSGCVVAFASSIINYFPKKTRSY
ncbi:MAG: hypothetical protein NC211_03060 [Alistipes senegalensis]|nr:hypothetical protein [Oxalobacter formigenes]MCM1280801.1 hypothetical protein [Alistipes senegalensis]